MNISLSQGQYQAIINLTQQNFSEEQHFVPEIYPIPIFKTVNLQVKIFIYGYLLFEFLQYAFYCPIVLSFALLI